ncbi:mutator-like transposase [Hordeum vulgare]|nr:mutator-like transposase [Hordeum vulgare]
MAPASKGPLLRRPGDPPPRYGPLEELFTVEINYGGFFCGLGSSKSSVDGKIARFDGCEADTWSPLWLRDFMQQLGYSELANYSLYWLLPGKNLGTGLRIVDSDTDTLSMIVVVPKFQFFQLFVDHKDMTYHNVLDGIQLTGTPNLSSMLSPNSATCNVQSSSSRVPPMQQEQQQQNVGHEPRRSERRQAAEGEARIGLDSGSEYSDFLNCFNPKVTTRITNRCSDTTSDESICD